MENGENENREKKCRATFMKAKRTLQQAADGGAGVGGLAARIDQVVVFTAAAVDVHMEGVYWLARLLDSAFPATAAHCHASDEIEEGWLVVRAQWYKYVPEAKVTPEGLARLCAPS